VLQVQLIVKDLRLGFVEKAENFVAWGGENVSVLGLGKIKTL
jgi:hypothetical protein